MPPPWLRDMIQANYYMGLSLGDAIGLSWDKIDFKEGVIAITRRKTGQEQLAFLVAPLRAVLRRLQFHQSLESAKGRVFVNSEEASHS
jgi:integrase